MAKNIQKVHEDEFGNILDQIQLSKQKAFTQVNAILVELYWNIGKYISQQVDKNSWGRGVVKELTEFIKEKEPHIKGFSDKNLWRMKQFFETYQNNQKLSNIFVTMTECSCKVGACTFCPSQCRRCGCECDGMLIHDKKARRIGHNK